MVHTQLVAQHYGHLHIHPPSPTKKKHQQIQATDYFGLFLVREPSTLSYCNVTCYLHVAYTQLVAQHFGHLHVHPPSPTKKKQGNRIFWAVFVT